jgi:hypothetical protein
MFMVDVLRRVEEKYPDRVQNCIYPFKDMEAFESWLNAFGVLTKVDITEEEIRTWAKMTMASQKKKKTPGDFDIVFFEALFRKVSK